MINKAIQDITLEDLNALVTNQIGEGKSLDYKETYSLKRDKEKGEFLADVASFANTSGGDLIIGVKEDGEGVAKKIKGIEVENSDVEKQRIENLILAGIDPRVSVNIKVVEVPEGKSVIVIRVKKSWTGPHRIKFKNYSKTKDQFYARNSSGNYQLDVHQLRLAFTSSGDLAEKIQQFQRRRVNDIANDDTPVKLYKDAKIVLHIVPASSFTPGEKINIKKVVDRTIKVPPICNYGYDSRINLNGFLTYSKRHDGTMLSYTQLYRNGTIEAVDSYLLSDEHEKKIIPSVAYEGKLMEVMKEYMKSLKALEITPPIFVFMTIIGANGFKMGVDRLRSWDTQHRIEEYIVNTPEVFVESYEETAEDILRPMFDVFWNACGYERSLNFNEEGEWLHS